MVAAEARNAHRRAAAQLDDERSRILCQLYEKALGEFESQQFRRAARTLGDFVPNYEDDGPSHILLWRAVNGLVQPATTFDPAG